MKLGWSMKSIDELAFVGRGKSRHRPRNEPSLYGGDHPFVQTADVHAADLTITSYSQTYSDKGLEQSKLWEPGTICITNAGENTGDCAILGLRACFPDSIIGVIADESKSDTVFLKYAIDRLKPQLRQVTRGATQDNLSLAKLLAFKFPTPPTEAQKRVGAVLAVYGALIDNNQRRMELLEQTARLLYQEWFIRLRFPGHEHTRITNGIPEGWVKSSIAELANVTMGQSPESQYYNEDGEGLPFHQGVADFGNRFVTNRIFTTALNRIAEAGDILCSVRAPVGRLNVTLDKIVIGRGLSAFRSLENHQSFLLYQLATHFFKEDLIGAGAIFASVTKTELLGQKLLTPPAKLIRAFEEISRPIDDQIRVLFLQNQKLRPARDLLVPRLMTGAITL